MEDSLKLHEPPAGATEDKIAWRSLHGPFDDRKNIAKDVKK